MSVKKCVLKKQISLDKFSVMTLGKYVSAMKPYIENERFQRKTQITSREYSTNIPTRPEVSEGDPPIASLIQVVPSEEPRDRQIKVSNYITRMDFPL